MATPESRTKARLKKLLSEFDVYYEMPVPSGFGKSSLDFVCCARGLYLQIETKAGNKDMTPRQRSIARQVEKAGGRAFLYNDNPKTHEELETWLRQNIESLNNTRQS